MLSGSKVCGLSEQIASTIKGETNGLAVLFSDLLKNLARSQRSTVIGYASVIPSDAAIPLTEIFKSLRTPYGKTSLPSVTVY